MKYAADFRRIAREKLYGKWKLAAGVFFIAVLLGGAITDGLNLKLEMEESFANAVVCTPAAIITVMARHKIFFFILCTSLL